MRVCVSGTELVKVERKKDRMGVKIGSNYVVRGDR